MSNTITGTTGQDTLNGTDAADLITGLGGNDSLSGGAGNDTLVGGTGNDSVDGGSGYNTYRVTGSADAYYWSVNAAGQVVLTDSVVDPAELTDGSDEGVDTLSNIQLIEYVRPDGSLESSLQIDDFSNAPDASNTQIQYGVWVNGRANFIGDVDYFKLETVAGQTVVASMGQGSTWGYLPQHGDQYRVDGIWADINQYGPKFFTWTTSGVKDIYFRSEELSSNSPMASKGYSFVLRRQLSGTDGADNLVAGVNYERLVGGLGDDTLIGSDRSDELIGGDGNDLLTGGKGNDIIDGGGGTANVAVFSGARTDYLATWTGNNLDLRLQDTVAGRDGIDQLVNVQILRFADGDVVLDAESNVPTAVGAVALGQPMVGSLPATSSWGQRVDIDYFQQKFTSDVTSSTALRISIQASANASSGQLYVQFLAAGSSDALTFKDLTTNSNTNQFEASLNSESQRSWFVSPQYWGSNSEWIPMAQRADVRVNGYTSNPTSQLGDLLGYTIRVDRVLFGSTGSDSLSGDGVSGYIDAREGNDSVTGSAISEEIIGGAGDDTIDGGAGNDILVDGVGVNVLRGGDGDDVIDVSGSNVPTSTVDGGSGLNTLKVASDTDWSGLAVTNIQVLDGSSGRTSLTPNQVASKGFTTAQNITFRLNPNLNAGGSLDGSNLSGNFNLRGTNQTDTLIGNSGNNTIYLNSDESTGSGSGADTVRGGGGDDRIVLQTRSWTEWSRFFSATDISSRIYSLNGSIDGGSGIDRFEINLQDSQHIYHAWGGYFYQTPWTLDLSNLNLSGTEVLAIIGNEPGSAAGNNGYPREVMLSALQIEGLNETSGLPSVAIVGGGAIDMAHLAAIGIKTWRIADSAEYTLTGTTQGDAVTVGAGKITVTVGDGNDDIVIDSKPTVTDVIDGGAGTDTLTIRGADVDLSGATIANIEAIKVSSQSLSMTDAQWQALGSIVSRAPGANTGYILSETTPGTTSLAADSPYVGLTGSAGADVLVGNGANNILVGGSGSDLLSGLGGNDRLVSGAGTDTLQGGEGDDRLSITDKTVVLDQISGGAGNDTLLAQDGQDYTSATLSDIEVLSGTGTVTLRPDQVAMLREINGLSVQLAGSQSSLQVSNSLQLTGGARLLMPQSDDTVTISSGIVGSKGDDTIVGSDAANVIHGGRGADAIDGGAGNDTIYGGSGADTLVGGAGDDRFEVSVSEFFSYGTTYSDLIDGGEGFDTLVVRFADGSTALNGPSYQISSGALRNVERLELTYYYANNIKLNADQWNALEEIEILKWANHWTDDPWTYPIIEIYSQYITNVDFGKLISGSRVSSVNLLGSFDYVDFRDFTVAMPSGETDRNRYSIKIDDFFIIDLSAGDDSLIIRGDNNYAVTAGEGDDWIRQEWVEGRLTATIEGGVGNDTFDVAGLGFVDLTGMTLNSVEAIYQGGSTVLVTEAQAAAWTFDGNGAKYTKSGNVIVGTSSADSFSGRGIEEFQGGRGNDSISNVKTVFLQGNYSEYDFVRSGNTLTIEQSRGDLIDGRDVLNSVMNLRFADTLVVLDDAPDERSRFTAGGSGDFASLVVADYGKQVSGKKDYASDLDVFASVLAPNSPLAVEASSAASNGWSMSFIVRETGQQLQFKSLVTGSIRSNFDSGMGSSSKWLPGFNTSQGFVGFQGGDVAFSVNVSSNSGVNQGITDYAFTLNVLDDYAGSIDTLGAMDPNAGVIRGYIGDIGDSDWIRIQLTADTYYEFKLSGVASSGGALPDPKLELRDSAGRLVESGVDVITNATGTDDTIVFRPTADGTFYLAASAVGGVDKGSWTLTQKSLDRIAGDVGTTGRIEWSGADTFTLRGEVNELSDHDWYRIWLDKGITYTFRAQGNSANGTLSDPQLSLRSATGILLAQDDNSGLGTDAMLVHSASDSGWYFLDAGASGNTGKGTYVLKGATLADDYAHTVLTTGQVQQGGSATGLISYIGDSDWFKVGLSAGVTYVIDLAGDLSESALLDPLRDPLLIIRDDTGDIVAKADDFGTTRDARAYFTPTEDGLYHLEARSAFKYDIGAYRLSVAVAPPDDHADDIGAAATALTLGAARTGEIGIPGDKDMFAVALEGGRVYQIDVKGQAGFAGTLADPYLRVFDSRGHLVDYDNHGGAGNDAKLFLAPSSSGTYYVEASAAGDRAMGSYTVSVVQRDIPADDVPNDLSTAVRLTPGDRFDGTLLTHHDQDWFRISLQAGEDYVFKVQASHSGNGTLGDPVLEIRAADSVLIASKDNMLVSNEPAMLFTPAASGEYILVVKAADGQTDTGTYALVTRTPDDHGNTKASATAIALNQTLNGGIQWADGSFGVRALDSIGLASDIDEDWFSFQAEAGQVLSFSARMALGSTLSRPMVEVIDTQGRSVALGDGLETEDGLAVATFRAETSGTFSARVIDGAGATGAYRVNLSAGDASDEDAQGPVAMSFTSAGAITQAQATARIGLSGDADTFTVSLSQGHHYRIETLPVRDGTHAPLASATLSLDWLANGAPASEAPPVAGEVASPSFFDVTEFTARTSGTLTMTVQPLEETQTGQYRIRVVDLGTQAADDRPDRVNGYADVPNGVLAANDNAQGRIERDGDVDLFAINLTAGNVYDVAVKSFADGLGTLAQSQLRLLDAEGQLVTSGAFDGATGRNTLSVSVFDDGRYYLEVGAADLPGNVGTYTVDTRLRGEASGDDDLSADTQSGAVVAPGQPVVGRIETAGDRDWMRLSQEAGKVYLLDVLADGDGAGGTLGDATLRLMDGSGTTLAFDDDSGAGLDAHLQFTAQSGGDHFVEVSANGASTGTYTVRLRELYSGVADPLRSAQWYLDAANVDLLNGRITGAGVTVGVVDDGIDTSHPDLQAQLDFSLAYDTQFNTQDGKPKYPVLIGPPDNHGTAVAGIIAAEANNETGIAGVAQDAELVSTRVKWTYDQITEALGLQHQFDISNNSWGATTPFGDNFNSTALTFAWLGLRTGVEDGRDGLGTVFVFSAGNGAAWGDNTNYHNFQNAREVITVGAAEADGSMAGFSTPGANVLVSSYGVGLLTTDRHQPGWGYEGGSNYTEFSGTSAAAPMVSGIAALMLEANPLLGYRDVQEILVYAATHPDAQDWKTNAATDFNLGGLRYNDQAGFGLVDAYNAVRLAETWQQTSTAVNEVRLGARAFGLNDAIPDGNSAYERTFSIDSSLRVEHVELGIDLRHTRLGDLIIELTSPGGTVSTLMNRPTVNAEQPFGLSGTDSGVPTHLLWDFSSVQFWGEDAAGDWTVTVRDVRAEQTGTIQSLSLRVYGERETGDDTYVFTDEGFATQSPRVLADEAGVDTVNLSTLFSDVYVHLGEERLIASQGVIHRIADWTLIENAFTGAGNDRLDGNEADNLLDAYSGDDTLTGGLGDDTLDGGAGSDTAWYAGAMAEFGVSWNPNTRVITVVDNKTSNGDEGTDVLIGIERLVFSDGEMNLGATVGNRAPVANRAFFDQTLVVAPGMGIDFDLPDDVFTDPDQQDDAAAPGRGKGAPPGISIAEEAGAELPEWLSFDPVTGKLTGVPPVDFRGQLKLKVKAVDEYGEEASDILTIQFGDNQAPLLDAAREWVLQEDAGLVPFNITAPLDPEGKAVTVQILELPVLGSVLDKQGLAVAVGTTLSADELSELHYQTAPDANGAVGLLRYRATDEDGVVSESSVRVFIDAVNDAPRFATEGSKLVIEHSAQSDVPLDVLAPSDPESVLTAVRVIELPSLGAVTLEGSAVALDQWLSLAQLQKLRFVLTENVNGPIGALTIQAVDPQGAATHWSLALEVQGDVAYSTGTAGADALYGSIGNDTLYGMAGDDTLVGNAGNDRLIAGLGNDQLFGGAGNDALDGSSGNDTLDGGTGNDTMSGGPGHDTYFVDSASDVVLEVVSGGAGGKDLIVTTVSRVAPANVENLQAAAGAASVDLIGNELDNVLMGNELANGLFGGAGRDTLIGGAGDDTLDGGSGVDRMAGGLGDDQYKVDSRSDVVIEFIDEGNDTVYARSSYTLSSHVQNLILLDDGDFSAGGNSLDNHLVGNSGNNTLAGGLGRDTLEGGLGDDVYVVNDRLDVIIDTGGIDTLRSSLDVVLQADLENVELVGIGDTTATGNGADNRLTGNMGDNVLDGAGGVDTLTGGAGSDQFVIGSNGEGLGPDQITDFTPGEDLLVIDLASFGIDVAALALSSSGTVAASSFVKGAGVRALDPDDTFLFDTARAMLMFDRDGSGLEEAIDLVHLIGMPAQSLTGIDVYLGV